MQEPNEDDTTPTAGWWSTGAPGWSEVADATYAAWKEKQVSRITLDADAALVAMEFGFGARAAYPKEARWEPLLARLEADWLASGREAEYPWEYVHNAVKAGWTAAPAPAKGRKPKAKAEPDAVEVQADEASSAETSTDETHTDETHTDETHTDASGPKASEHEAERNVPGGRPDAVFMVSTPTSGLQDAPRVPGGRPDRPS